MKKNDHFIYPAIFSGDAQFIGVRFPDLPGCNTFGKDLDDALFMARDALSGHLLCMDEDGDPFPNPTPFNKIHAQSGETVVLIEIWFSALRTHATSR